MYQFHTSPPESVPETVNVEDEPLIIVEGFELADIGSEGIFITSTVNDTHDVVLHDPSAATK